MIVRQPLFVKRIFLLVSFCLFWRVADATHIRAGEITAKRIDNLTRTFEFTFTGFRDSGSVIHFGDGIFNFGDGVTQERGFQIVETPIDNEIEMVQFKIVHTYQANSTYLVSYEEKFRNEGISNMDNSVGTSFYVESLIVIDPFFGLNNTPILTVPPIDFAAEGAKFIHNAGAFDPDGDSLSYSFVNPKQARGTDVNNYRKLNDPAFYTTFAQGNEDLTSTPKLTIDPVSGNLIWDAPGDKFEVLNREGCAEFNIAFVVTEWRNIEGTPVRLGFVTRDMQIIVCETDNERPELDVPEDLCVEAGQTVSQFILGSDPDGQQVKIEAFGGPFEVQGSQASFQPSPPRFQDSPAAIDFQWTTQCGHVRVRPYEIQFKVTDNPDIGPRLVNFESMEITVVGPAPEGLSSTVQPGRSIQLDWQEYQCTNAEAIEIWRRVGEFEIEIDECVTGMPPNSGYRLVETIPIYQPGQNGQVTTYLDNNAGRGLSVGGNYCYRIVASYPLPGGGKSYVSSEVCDSIIVDVPAITNVDIINTSEDNGSILVRWVPPYQINSALYPPAYTYDLFRATGLSPSNSYTQVASGISDTVFVDNNVNTASQSYHYFVRFYSGNLLVDSSATASTVRLDLRPLLNSIEVSWSADVPWSNVVQNYPYHYVYRNQVDAGDLGKLVLIDSVDVTRAGFNYLDNGQVNGQLLDDKIEYCYFISANGSYDNSLFPEPLVNRSQMLCGQPNDTIPPCTPPSLTITNQFDCSAQVADVPCGTNIFEQEISWSVDEGLTCGDDLSHYNIYFSKSGSDKDFEIVGTSTQPLFLHSALTSFKGCYKVTAQDRSGNESEPTEVICNDNCPVYKLPNVFTPNNDGLNDVFTPFVRTANNLATFNDVDCPRFILSVDFRVFDRSGSEIFRYNSYEHSNGININWDGKNNMGQALDAGVYFYSAELELDVLEGTENKKTLKGWVQILK